MITEDRDCTSNLLAVSEFFSDDGSDRSHVARNLERHFSVVVIVSTATKH